jgi:xylulokinase
VLEALNPELAIREVRVTGGGQQSSLWNRIKADALQTPVVRVTRREGAPLGAALLAGYGVGLIGDLDDAARKWIRTDDAVRPQPAFAAHYRMRVDRYRRLLDAMQKWSDPAMGGLP